MVDYVDDYQSLPHDEFHFDYRMSSLGRSGVRLDWVVSDKSGNATQLWLKRYDDEHGPEKVIGAFEYHHSDGEGEPDNDPCCFTMRKCWFVPGSVSAADSYHHMAERGNTPDLDDCIYVFRTLLSRFREHFGNPEDRI